MMTGAGMLRFAFLLLVVPTACRSQTCQSKQFPQRTCSGRPGFPSAQDFTNLAGSLQGDAMTRQDPGYATAYLVYNRRFHQRPYVIYFVESVDDVQKVIAFARQHNLEVSVRSSGHSFVGRSTNQDGVVINVSRLKGKQFSFTSTRSTAGEITVQSGNKWLEVYEAVDGVTPPDNQKRVVVGGSAHDVAMGGYTLGGGHSPICRKLGMAVDNLLEATIVLADGSKAVVNGQGTTLTFLNGTISTSSNTDLFWAIRGGGGNAWGVVMDFTFKLHFAPERFRNILINWALYYKGADIGTGMTKFVLQQLEQLSDDWGGYVILTTTALDTDTTGSLSLFLNHFGSNSSASNSEVDDLLNYNPIQAQFGKLDRYFSTFLEYERNAHDDPKVNGYIFNTFIQPSITQSTAKLVQLAEFMMGLKNRNTLRSVYACTFTLIGGQMGTVASGATPVNPSFRSGLFSATCGGFWSELETQDGCFIEEALEMRNSLAALGEGSYFNEPAEDLDDWKIKFWGNDANYNRLLQIKQQWDPDLFFWCHNCVGADLETGGTPCPGEVSDNCQCSASAWLPSVWKISASVIFAWWCMALLAAHK